jgi:hypothetical protein
MNSDPCCITSRNGKQRRWRILPRRRPVQKQGNTMKGVPRNGKVRTRRNLLRNEDGWTVQNPTLPRNPEGSHQFNNKPEEGKAPG